MTTRIKVKYKDYYEFTQSVNELDLDVNSYFNKVTFFYNKKVFNKCEYCIIDIKQFDDFFKFCMRNKLGLPYTVV